MMVPMSITIGAMMIFISMIVSMMIPVPVLVTIIMTIAGIGAIPLTTVMMTAIDGSRACKKEQKGRDYLENAFQSVARMILYAPIENTPSKAPRKFTSM